MNAPNITAVPPIIRMKDSFGLIGILPPSLAMFLLLFPGHISIGKDGEKKNRSGENNRRPVEFH